MHLDVKRILLRIFVLILPVVFCLLYMELELQSRDTSYSLKRKYFETQLDSIEVLTLGSSQPLQAINPSYFSNTTFNLAEVSQTLYYDYELVKMYLGKMPKLKAVIIPISYFSLFEEMIESEPKREYFYCKYWDICVGHLSKWDIDRYSLVSLMTPLTSLKLIIRPEDSMINHMGWKCLENNDSSKITDVKGRMRVLIHENGSKKNIPNNVSYLEGLILLLQSKNIQPIFITTPVYKTYYTNIDKERKGLTDRHLNRLAEKYEIPYLDHFSSSLFDVKDFSDNDHLNRKGSTKYSILLNSLIKPLL